MRKILCLMAVSLFMCAGCVPPGGPSAKSGSEAVDDGPFTVRGMTNSVLEIEAALGTEKLKALQEKYEKDFKTDPKNPFKIFLWAYSLSDRNTAWGELTKITKLNEKFYWTYLGMAVILDGWKVDDQAETNFKKVLELGPKIAIGHGRYGKMYLRKQDAGQALPLLETAVSLDPGQVSYLLDLARALDLAERSKEALEKYKKALQMDSTLFAAAAEQADLLRRMGEKEAAVEAYAKAASLDEKAYEVRFARAVLLVELNRNDEGIAAMQQACEVKPSELKCWQELAALGEKLGKKDTQVLAYESVIKLEQGNLPAHKFLAPVYLEAGDIEKALPSFKKVLRKEPENLVVLAGMATIYEKGGEFSQAIEFNERVIALAPKHEAALEARKRLFERFKIVEPPITGKNPDKVFARNRQQLATVYKELIEKKPNLQGDILLKVTVGDTGDVVRLEMAKNTVGSQIIDLCAYWNMKRSRFPVGFGATYDFELTLTPPKK